MTNATTVSVSNVGTTASHIVVTSTTTTTITYDGKAIAIATNAAIMVLYKSYYTQFCYSNYGCMHATCNKQTFFSFHQLR